jgi:hypothetical protein
MLMAQRFRYTNVVWTPVASRALPGVYLDNCPQEFCRILPSEKAPRDPQLSRNKATQSPPIDRKAALKKLVIIYNIALLTM